MPRLLTSAANLSYFLWHYLGWIVKIRSHILLAHPRRHRVPPAGFFPSLKAEAGQIKRHI
jgi:hypothetical protein